jgi:hypothetical protein
VAGWPAGLNKSLASYFGRTKPSFYAFLVKLGGQMAADW